MAKLYFKYGAMGSSKTATALITKYNYEERGMKVWLIKPSADSRDGQFTLKSRIGLSSECEAIGPECDLQPHALLCAAEGRCNHRRRMPVHDHGADRPAARAGGPGGFAGAVLRLADGFPDEALPRQPEAV